MFSIRSLQAAILVAIGLHERQTEQVDFATRGFELYDVETGAPLLPITAKKAYNTPLSPDTTDETTVHVTAVRGGFGVSKSRVQYWREEIDDAFRHTNPLLVAQLYEAHKVPVGEILPLELAARRLATWERFKNVPYHGLGIRNGDCIANHPLSRHSWHGNAGNRGTGWALDCAPDEKLEAWMIETGRVSFEIHCARMYAWSSRVRTTGLRILAHRQHSASRRQDPGAYVWREVIKPVVSALDYVDIDYWTKTSSGLQIPRSWDDAALYDDKGRKVA